MTDRPSRWDKNVWWVKLPDTGRERTALPHEAVEIEKEAVLKFLRKKKLHEAADHIERGEHRHG